MSSMSTDGTHGCDVFVGEPARNPWVVLALTSLAQFAVFLDTTVLFVAFPSIRRSFPQVSNGELSWVLNGYSIVFAAVLLPGGRLADHFGRRKLFLLGVAIFTLSSMLCGAAENPWQLITFRAAQAAGGALLLPSSLALVLDSFPKSRRAVAVTTWGAVGGLAAATGPSLGGAVIQAFGWRWVFYLNVPVGLVAIVLAVKVLHESRDVSARQTPEFSGILLSIGGMASLTYGIIHSEDVGWMDGQVIAAVSGGMLALALLLWLSAKSSSPLLDLALFHDRTFRFANSATLTLSIGFYAMYINNVLFLTQAWHYSTLVTGLALTPAPLLVTPIAVASGRIAAKLGHRPLVAPGGLIFAAAAVWQWGALTAHPAYLSQWLPIMILMGVGVGLTSSALASASAHNLPASRYAMGAAFNSAVRQVGSVLGVALALALPGVRPQIAAVTGFRRVFVLIIVCGALTSLLAAGIRTKPDTGRD